MLAFRVVGALEPSTARTCRACACADSEGGRPQAFGGCSITGRYPCGGMPVLLVVECVGSGVMNMTEKNGQPSMEEILASIRRIIAEEPVSHHNGELRGTPIMLKGDGVLDEAGEFDLPAIFRASPPPAAERSAPLLGRLSDAIRSATTSTSNGEHASPATETGEKSGLSSLKAVRSETAPVEPLQQLPSAPAAAPNANGEEPKRVMAAFKDTHFMRMGGGSSAAPTPTPVAPQAAAPAPAADFTPYAPAQFDSQPQHAAPHSYAAPEPMVASPLHVAPVIAPPPPPLPATGDANRAASGSAGSGETGIEDATADLLRPMLRQWLSDNMPRMVEKALHIELAESIKAPRKP